MLSVRCACTLYISVPQFNNFFTILIFFSVSNLISTKIGNDVDAYLSTLGAERCFELGQGDDDGTLEVIEIGH